MSAFLTYRQHLQEAYSDYKNRPEKFSSLLIILLVLNCFNAFPWEITGLESGSTPEILLEILIGICGLVITVAIINREHALLKNSPEEEMKYLLPTFFITTLYYTLIFLFGLMLFVIPGLLAMWFFSLAPLVSILDPDSSPLKKSMELTKKNPVLVLLLLLATLALELIPASFRLIPLWEVRTAVLLAIAYPLSLLGLVVIQSSLRVYYHLEYKAE